MEPVLRIENVSKIYKEHNCCVEAISDITFAIAPHSFLVLAGPSGSGFLWVAALISLLSSERTQSIYLGVAAVAAFTAEVIGVATGLIFGSYQYTGALGFAIFNVPIAIAAAWIILLAYVWHSISRLKLGVLPGAILGAAWMTAIDLVIDPLAAGPLSYWRWQDGGWYYGIPLSNFAGWFGISFVLLLFLHRRPLQSAGAKRIGLSVLIFFTYVAAVNGLWIPAFIGVALTMLDLRLFASRRFSSGVVSAVLCYMSLFCVTFTMPFYLLEHVV